MGWTGTLQPEKLTGVEGAGLSWRYFRSGTCGPPSCSPLYGGRSRRGIGHPGSRRPAPPSRNPRESRGSMGNVASRRCRRGAACGIRYRTAAGGTFVFHRHHRIAWRWRSHCLDRRKRWSGHFCHLAPIPGIRRVLPYRGRGEAGDGSDIAAGIQPGRRSGLPGALPTRMFVRTSALHARRLGIAHKADSLPWRRRVGFVTVAGLDLHQKAGPLPSLNRV